MIQGATRLLLVSSDAACGGDAQAQGRNAIGAARDAGVVRIVRTSRMGTSAPSPFPPMHEHAAAEQALAAPGLPWAALRNGFYAGTLPMLPGAAAGGGRARARGAVPWSGRRAAIRQHVPTPR